MRQTVERKNDKQRNWPSFVLWFHSTVVKGLGAYLRVPMVSITPTTHTHLYQPINLESTWAAWSQSLVVSPLDPAHTHTHRSPRDGTRSPAPLARRSLAGIGLQIIDGGWRRSEQQAENAGRARQVRTLGGCVGKRSVGTGQGGVVWWERFCTTSRRCSEASQVFNPKHIFPQTS